MLLSAPCAECPSKLGYTFAEKVITVAERLLSPCRQHAEFSFVASPPNTMDKGPPPRHLSRRDLFGIFLGKRQSNLVETREKEHDVGTGFVSDHMQSASGFYTVHEALCHLSPKEQPVETEGLPLAFLTIDEKCDGCMLCVHLCPMKALKEDSVRNSKFGIKNSISNSEEDSTDIIDSAQPEDKVSISFIPFDCRKCDLCLDVCPQGAIQYADTIDLSVALSESEKEQIIWQQKRLVCGRCGIDFVSIAEAPDSGEQLCQRCKNQMRFCEHLVNQL